MMTALLVLTGCFEGEDSPDGDTLDGDIVDGDITDGDTVDGDITDGDTDGNSGNAAFSFEVSPGTLSVYFQSMLDSYTEYPANTFAWDFGDGETGSGHSINHEYAIPGSYTVSLTVTLDGSTEETSHDVLINGWGVVKWKFEFEDTQWGVESGNGSMALAEDGTIYALVTPSRSIYSIAPDGTKNWKFNDFDHPHLGGCADPIFSNLTQTLYVVCSMTPEAQAYTTIVTAITHDGQKKWTTQIPDGQTSGGWGLALRSVPGTGTDELYLSTAPGPLEDQKASIYVINSSGGGITKSSYESTLGIIGLAFGPGDSLHVLLQDGHLDVLSPEFATLWSYEPQTPTTQRGYMAIDSQGRVFVPLTNPPSLVALYNNPNNSTNLLWTYATTGDPGPPSITANGDVCVLERSFGLKTFAPSDGSLIWEANQYAYSGSLAIAALADGTLLAEVDHAQVAFSADGESLGWGPPALMTSPTAVANDGTYYIYGLRSHDTVYADALYAVYGPSPLAPGWSRPRANNANTARVSSGQK